MAHDVFVSYSSLDKPIADAACATLEAHGLRCWIAPRDIVAGVDWSDAIIDAITDSSVFVLVLSTASNQSEQVKREVQNAVAEAKPILPFRIEEVDLSKHMRYFIGTPHWLDAMSPPMEAHLLRMAQTVSALISSVSEKGLDPPPQMRPVPFEIAPVTASTPAVASSPVTPAVALSDDTIASAGQALAVYVGPFARILAKKAAKEATSRADFYNRLADQINKPTEKAAFLRKFMG